MSELIKILCEVAMCGVCMIHKDKTDGIKK